MSVELCDKPADGIKMIVRSQQHHLTMTLIEFYDIIVGYEMDEDFTEEKIEQIRNLFKSKLELETYNDYPDAVSNNAKRGIELNKKVNNKCATDVGKIRAQQLAQKEKVSTDTIKRMYSYLSRAEAFYDPSDPEACGTISYLLWGGKSAKNWAESKINKLNLYTEVVNDDYAIINDRLGYSTQEKAEEMAKDIGCDENLKLESLSQ